MDIKEYIASGTLESYATGLASEQERREVECLTSIYPELKAELDRIQRVLEEYSQSIAVSPPEDRKERILEAIKGVKQDSPLKIEQAKSSVQTSSPVDASQPQTDKPDNRNVFLRIAVAASVVILIGLGYYYRQLQADYNELQTTYQEFQSESETEVNQLKNSLDEKQQERALLTDEATQTIVLNGTELSPESKVRLYWNPEKEAFVYVSEQLPVPAADKQYQLWAIVDGAPVDMGMLNDAEQLTAAKQLPSGALQAFAITLEKKGGSEVPTLEAMYVMGSV